MPEKYFAESRLVAILRGLTPDEAIAQGDAIVNAGWRCLEVPLNSPEPFESIRLLAAHFGDKVLVGAGTVLTPADVQKVFDVGGRLIVAPNTDDDVVKKALSLNMVMMPGVYTATEAFHAYKIGVRYLKLFPADSLGPSYVRALKSVLPKDAKIIPTGGVSVDTIAAFHAAGCHAFGIGSQLYKKGVTPEEVGKRARALSDALKLAESAT
ncbi:MAG: 2-dehydro-3-deoxy-6-phosphogalactonate aldolase [Micavibrio sp.]|nr:2-dehydro-3-deoxy-6-phosphogalactonate aldolase [Micavibrio sp.]